MPNTHLLPLCLMACLTLSATPAPAQPEAEDDRPVPEPTRLAARIQYSHNAIIIATADAVAVVRLTQTAPFTVRYEYRLLDMVKAGEESKGSGRLFDEPMADKPALTWIETPRFRLEWSYSADDLGWLYYKPEHVALWFVKVDDFPDIELRRFLRRRGEPERIVSRQHRQQPTHAGLKPTD